MATKAWLSPWIRRAASAGLLSVVALGVFYYFHFSRRTRLLDDSYMRQTATAADNLASALLGLQESLTNLRSGPPDSEPPDCDSLKEALRQNPAFDPTTASCEGKQNRQIEFRLERKDGSTAIVFETGWGLKGTPNLGPQLYGGPFATMFLAAGSGNVLFYTRGGAVRLSTVPRTKMATTESAGALKNAVKDQPRTSETVSVTAADKLLASEIREVEISGRPYRLYLQPLPAPLDVRYVNEPHVDAPWIVGGLVPSSDYRVQAMVISPTLVIFGIGVLVVAILIGPYLKFRFMGAREAVRGNQLVLLLVSVLIAFALATLATIHTLAYQATLGLRKELVEQVGERIRQNIKDELSLLQEQLIQTSVARTLGTPVKDAAGDRTRSDRQKLISQDIKMNVLAYSSSSAYPYFDVIFWIDKNGQQMAKELSTGRLTPLLRLEDREYFQRALHDEMWFSLARTRPPEGPTVREPTTDSKNPFKCTLLDGRRFVESIRSKTTGAVAAVLSLKYACERPIPVSDAAVRTERAPIVAAIQAPLLSVVNPVLPAGMQFAVVDEKGKTLFHSNTALNLREDFFDELDPSMPARAAAITGRAEHLELMYRSVPSLAWMGRVDADIPWTVVVLLDQTADRFAGLDMVSFSLALESAYLVLMVLVSLWLHFIGRPYLYPGEPHAKWYWPDSRRSPSYHRILICELCGLVAWASAEVWGGPEIGLVFAGFLAVIGLTITHSLLKVGSPFENRTSTSNRCRNRIMCTLLVLGLALAWSASQSLQVEYWTLLTIVLAVVLLSRSLIWLILLTCGVFLTLVVLVGQQGNGHLGVLLVAIALVGAVLLCRWLPDGWVRYSRILIWGDRLASRWQGTFLAASLSLAVASAILPTFSIYRAVHDEVVVLLARDRERSLALSLRQRWRAQTEKYERTRIRSDISKQIDADWRTDGRAYKLTVYGPCDWLRIDTTNRDNRRSDGFETAKGTPVRLPLISYFRRWLPTYSEEATILRSLAQSVDLQANQEDDVVGGGETAGRECERSTGEVGNGRFARSFSSRLRMRSQQQPLGSPEHPLAREPASLSLSTPIESLILSPGVYWILAFALIVGVVAWIINDLVSKIFLLKMPQHGPAAVRPPLSASSLMPNRLLLRHSDDTAAEERFVIGWADIRGPSSSQALASAAANASQQTIVLAGLAAVLNQRRLALKALRLLERLVSMPDHTIVIESDVDPLYYFAARSFENPRRHEFESAVLARWATALESFQKIRAPRESVARTVEATHEWKHSLELESQARPSGRSYVAQLCDQLALVLPKGDRANLTRDSAIDETLDLAAAHYWRLWSVLYDRREDRTLLACC